MKAALPAVVLVTRKSTYDADADACIATWTESSGASLGSLDDETRALVCKLVKDQVKQASSGDGVFPRMHHASRAAKRTASRI